MNTKKQLAIWSAAALCALTIGLTTARSLADESPRPLPLPAIDEASAGVESETVVLAGGCFWGMQGVFQHVKGVTSAVAGYTGGDQFTAHYEVVETGATGHAESVSITFDPRQISYGKILQIYFSVAHDPTQLNRQGPDVGSQYRSAIFPATDEQARVAQAYIQQLGQAHVYSGTIVTRLEPGKAFYTAEGYHQDFLTLNPHNPYIVYNELPKIAALKRLFPDFYRTDATHVLAAG